MADYMYLITRLQGWDTLALTPNNVITPFATVQVDPPTGCIGFLLVFDNQESAAGFCNERGYDVEDVQLIKGKGQSDG